MKQIGQDPYSPAEIYRMGLVQDNLLACGWNEITTIKDRWTFQNPDGTRPTGVSDATYATYQNSSDYWLIDASYLRCKTINLGYSLPAGILGKIKGISSIRASVDIQNAFTITKYPMLDPEQKQSNYYPYNRSVVFGLDVIF